MANVYMGTDVEEFIFGEGTTYVEACKKEEVEAPVEEPEVKVEESVEEPEVVEEEFEVTDEEMNAHGVIECVDDPEVACYRIALENEQNYNMIMNAFMMKEFSVLESTGVEMVYEAADVKKFFTLVKETIARWWSKIQGVIKKVIDSAAQFADQDLRFIKKYKDAKIVTPENAKPFPGFDFDKVKKVPDYAQIAGEVSVQVNLGIKAMTTEKDAEAYVTKFNEEFKGVKDKMRALACGSSGAVSEEAFAKELQMALFGSEEKVNIALKPFAELLRDMEGAKLVKASAKRAYKSAQDAVKKLHKEVKRAESAINRERGGMKIAKCMTDSINATLSIMSRAMSAETRAMMTKLRQDRAMAVFYVSNQPKAEKKEKVAEATTALDDMGIVLI